MRISLDIGATLGGLTELREAASDKLSSAGAQLAALDASWERIEKEVSADWTERKLEIAPGNEILDAVWRGYDGRYDKRRDGPKIAAAMKSGPDEIRETLRGLLPSE